MISAVLALATSAFASTETWTYVDFEKKVHTVKLFDGKWLDISGFTNHIDLAPADGTGAALFSDLIVKGVQLEKNPSIKIREAALFQNTNLAIYGTKAVLSLRKAFEAAVKEKRIEVAAELLCPPAAEAVLYLAVQDAMVYSYCLSPLPVPERRRSELRR
jgi:hypothetical protein